MRRQAAAILCLLAGCAGGPAPTCNPARATQTATLEREHTARLAAGEEPALDRSPGEKGPSPEGIEAIALLEKQILDAGAEGCAKP